jgi:transposase
VILYGTRIIDLGVPKCGKLNIAAPLCGMVCDIRAIWRMPNGCWLSRWSPAKRGGRRREVNVREVLNAIFYVLSTGCQWQALPKDLPPKSTAHSYFMLWDWDGTLERIHHALYVATREREGREATQLPRSSIVKAPKRLKKGLHALTRRALMRRGPVLDETTEVRILLVADRRFERERLLSDLQDLAHPLEGHAEFFRQFPRPARGRSRAGCAGSYARPCWWRLSCAPECGWCAPGRRSSAWSPDGSTTRVGQEFVATAVIEFLNGLHQADVAFLDQVEELQTAVGVFLRDVERALYH